MSESVRRKVIFWLALPALVGAMLFQDWDHFFPLAAQPDLRFQMAGELVGLLVVLGAFFAMPERQLRTQRPWTTGTEAFFTGLIFAVLLLALDWRKLFSDHHFNPSGAIRLIVGNVFAGCFFGAYSLLWDGKTSKPSKEQEKSVV